MTKTRKKTDHKDIDTGKMQDFSADVSRLLDIVANALYTNHDVFLRELISNAADACDRLRYDAIENPELTKDDPAFRIHVWPDREKRIMGVFDNGIGMNGEEMAEHLGTIAKSGTAKIMEQIKASNDEGANKMKLIGQFGVGFYASYMVADMVKVVSRKAGEDDIWTWKSDGRTGFTVEKASPEEAFYLSSSNRGTAIILDIKDSAVEFLLEDKIRMTVEQYSDHIDVPIYNVEPAHKDSHAPINQATAIWARPKSEISEEDYENFYRHITHGLDEPLLTSHWKAEGTIEFSALLYVPTLRPFDLYDPGRKGSVKLYVRRVFISDCVENLMYPWMRFVRGVIDSEDLPLNISRETLQYNPIIEKIRTAVTKRVLGDLDKLGKTDIAAFDTFWGQFGAAIKEGLYDATQHRDDIFKVCRFFSTHAGGEMFVSLEDYVSRMKDGQKDIYYISGENIQSLINSPQLEGFKSRGLEVLLMTDTIDDFWLQQVQEYKDFKFQSVTKGNIDLKKFDGKAGDEENTEEKTDSNDNDIKPLLELIKKTLEENVDDVRVSNRLTNSPVCLVAPEHGVDMHMERVLKVHQKYQGQTKPVLEINKDHSLIKKMIDINSDFSNEDKIRDLSWLLFDQAKIIQGEPISDPTAFVRRMSQYLENAI